MGNKYKFVKYEPSRINFYNREGEKILEEISLAAISTETDKFTALGREAEEYRNSENTVVGSPLRNGIVADFDVSSVMFKGFIKALKNKIHKTVSSRLYSLIFNAGSLKIAVCAPMEMTPVENRALHETIACCGVKKLLILENTYQNSIRNIPKEYELIIEIIPE